MQGVAPIITAVSKMGFNAEDVTDKIKSEEYDIYARDQVGDFLLFLDGSHVSTRCPK